MSTALTIQLDKPVKDVDGCRGLMASFHKQIANTLPKHIPEAVLFNAVLNSIRKNELAYQKGKTKSRLTDCSAASMLSAIMCCAETGLIPDSPAQECHLIPFGGQVTWMPGYRGLIRLARQSGDVADVETAVVFEKDKFSCVRGLNQDLKLEEADGDRGEMVKVYAIIFYTDARIRPRFEVMSKADVDKVRSHAPGKGSDAWVKWYEEQARKTVLKRLLKTAPFSPQLVTAIDRDNQIEIEGTQELHDTVKELVGTAIESRKPATQRLTDELKAKNGNGQTEPAAETVGPTPEVDEAKEAAIKEVLTLATDNEVVVRQKVIDQCNEMNLRMLSVEEIGVIKSEIQKDIKKAEALAAKG